MGWHRNPSVGLIIGMCIFNLSMIISIGALLVSLFHSIFVRDPFERRCAEVVQNFVFILFIVGMVGMPDIFIVVRRSTHSAAFILGAFNLACYVLPVLVFLMAVLVKMVRLQLARLQLARLEATRIKPV